MSPSNPWLTTEELCAQLAISRSTLFAIKRSGLLKAGRHLVPKNPGCRRSHLLCTARTEQTMTPCMTLNHAKIDCRHHSPYSLLRRPWPPPLTLPFHCPNYNGRPLKDFA
jgi:hypothetical protein